MNPLVALVGRPNVGKSTLANRLAGRRVAIVDSQPGVTRDRLYMDTDWAGRSFTIVDTGGLDPSSTHPLTQAVHGQALLAAEQADLVLFVVDGTEEPLLQDYEVAQVLRRSRVPVLLVANKVDQPGAPLPEGLYRLGFGEPTAVSALHGTQTGDLLDIIVSRLPEAASEEPPDDIAIAVVGRPNAGKSTLVNALLGEERMVVSSTPGTTRDAIDSVIEHEGCRVRLVDTAGLRRRSRIGDLEYYGRVRALAALERADLAVLVLDGVAGAADQDQRIAQEALRRGCALVVALSKWDLVKTSEREDRFARAAHALRFAAWAPMRPVSALKRQGFAALWAAIASADEASRLEVATHRLNAFVQQLKSLGHTVRKRGKTLRLSYAVQTGTRPPRFLFFCNHPELADDAFSAFVERKLREAFPLEGTPVRVGFARK